MSEKQVKGNEFAKKNTKKEVDDEEEEVDDDDNKNDVISSENIKARDKEADELEHPFKYSNDTSDLRLIVEGRPLYVSRVVLSLVSPVLKSIFTLRGTGDNVELPLPGKKYDHMVQFLCCIYPDILAPISGENVEMLLSLADEFQSHRLLERCEDFLIKEIEIISPKPTPEKIVLYLNIAEKYRLDALQKSTFETAAKTPSDLLENVQEFWELPSVTTTSVFIRRLKILEQSGKAIRSKVKEVQNHCSLYHKGERNGDNVCTKCFANIGKHAQSELKYF